MNEWWRECDKPGCEYIARGRTEKQTVARMASHWTSEDHREHVLSIIAELANQEQS